MAIYLAARLSPSHDQPPPLARSAYLHLYSTAHEYTDSTKTARESPNSSDLYHFLWDQNQGSLFGGASSSKHRRKRRGDQWCPPHYQGVSAPLALLHASSRSCRERTAHSGQNAYSAKNIGEVERLALYQRPSQISLEG